MPSQRPPKPNPAPKGGVAKPSEGPNVSRVRACIQRMRKRRNGVLTDEDILHLKNRLRRARYADEYGGYPAGDAAIAAEEALADIAAKKARAREFAFMCGPSQATIARQQWTERDPQQADVRAQSAREPTPKAGTPQTGRVSTGTPRDREKLPVRNLFALLAASPMAATPVAETPVAATPRELPDPTWLEFSDETPSA